MSDIAKQTPEFRQHAVDRKLFEHTQRLYLRYHMDTELPATEQIVVEELPRSESVITQKELMSFLDRMAVWENRERVAMSEFEHVRRPLPPFSTPEAFDTDDQEEKAAARKPTKKRAKRKPTAT